MADTRSFAPFKSSILFLASALLIIIILFVGTLQYLAERKQVLMEYSRDMTSIGKLKAAEIDFWRRERLADATRFALGPSLARAIYPTLNTAELKTILTINCKSSSYRDALLAKPDGTVVLSASGEPLPLPPKSQEAVERAVSKRQTVFSELFVLDSSSMFIDTVAPITAPQQEIVGVIILRSSADDFLFPSIRTWPVESETAETLLIRSDGDSVVSLTPARHLTSARQTFRFPMTRLSLPAVQAALGREGIFHGYDYRNVEVLSDIRPIPNSNWYLVTKVDYAEVFSNIRYRATVIAFFVLLAILLTAALTAFGHLSRQTHLLRNLFHLEQQHLVEAEKFRTILYSIGDAVITTDDRGHILQMNPIAEHLTGWQEGEAKGKPLDTVFVIVNAETREPLENPATRILRDGKIVGLTNRTLLVAKNGREISIADSGSPVLGNDGAFLGIVLVFRDQTSEYMAQKALRESEQQYADLFHNMTEGFALHEIICDPNGKPADYRFLKVNPAFEHLTGLRAEQIIGRRLLEIIPTSEHPWIQTYGTVALQGKTIHFENYSSTLDRYYRVTAFCPRPGQFCTIFTDITERKKAEIEQVKLQNQLHQSQKLEAIGRLAGGIAHDFNNMLAIILGNAEIALDDLDPKTPLHAELEEISKAGKKSADMVRQLLAFASRQTITPRLLNLNTTLGSMLPMLRRLIDEEIIFEWHPGADLWDIWFDPNQLEQILINLIVNARDAIVGAGRISITTQNVPETVLTLETEDLPLVGEFVMFSVCDTGCGMNEDVRSHIFEPFFTTKTNAIGTGLGLPTVYGILKQNRGGIHVISSPDEGSRFLIYLPRYKNPATSSPAVAATPPTGSAVLPQPPVPPQSPDPATILLVEDEAALLVLVRAMLQNLGHTVLAASNPREAIKIAQTHKGGIDLLLTDVVMPEMSGHDLWQNLQADMPKLKCLYMSGYTADILAHHGVINDTQTDFIQKPFSKTALKEKLSVMFSS